MEFCSEYQRFRDRKANQDDCVILAGAVLKSFCLKLHHEAERYWNGSKVTHKQIGDSPLKLVDSPVANPNVVLKFKSM
jgi:hypothetical protein